MLDKLCLFFFQEVLYESYVYSLLLSFYINILYFLMSIKLFSCGELIVICQGVRGGVILDMYCLLNLIVWFVCLVSFSVNIIDYVEVCGVFFYVVGLQ